MSTDESPEIPERAEFMPPDGSGSDRSFGRPAVRYLIAALIAVAVATAMVADEFSSIDPDGAFGVIVTLLAIQGTVALWSLAVLRSNGIGVARLLRPVPLRTIASYLWLVPFHFVAAVAGIYTLHYPLSFVAPDLVERILNDASLETGGPIEITVIVSIGCVVAPIVEEIGFRVVALHRFARRWRSTAAGIAASSILFGIAHADVVGVAVFGIMLSAVYLRTRSLLPTIVLHAVNNAIAFLIVGFLEVGPEYITAGELQSEAWLGAICIPITAIVVVLFVRASREAIAAGPPETGSPLIDLGHEAGEMETEPRST